ncbi:ATP-binding protein [Streptomyces sp. NPDC060194]|uniref:ATP-binding protein n=1 Tax=Streptomyces sp. NPDC060194 TaxID=3347069 RepID=UPI003649A0C1
MARVEAPPTDRTVPVVRALLLAIVLTSAATVGAAALAEQAARIPLLLAGVAATVAVAALSAVAARRRLDARAREQRDAVRIADLERRLAGHDDRLAGLADEVLPAVVRQLRASIPPTRIRKQLREAAAAYEDLPSIGRLVEGVIAVVDHEILRRQGAEHSFVGVARRVQTIVAQQAIELREMEEDHGFNPEVFDDLLRIDHGNALIGRLVDSIAVMSGSKPARQWRRNVALFSVLRGAMSRILEYPRIKLDSVAKVGIVAPAVESVIHLLAEILDNATRYSPPTSKVRVSAVEVPSGVAIEIEDSGVRLTETARLRIEKLLHGAMQGTDVDQIGESPRLGIAVVGRLATMWNIQVSLRSSAYGGLRTVVVVPSELLGEAPPRNIIEAMAHGIGALAQPGPDGKMPRPPRSHGRPPKEEREPKPAAVPAAVPGPAPSWQVDRPAVPRSRALSADDDEPVVTEWTEDGLPQRRSKLRAQLEMPPPAPAPRPRAPEPTTAPGIRVEQFISAAKGLPHQPPPARESGEPRDEEDQT